MPGDPTEEAFKRLQASKGGASSTDAAFAKMQAAAAAPKDNGLRSNVGLLTDAAESFAPTRPQRPVTYGVQPQLEDPIAATLRETSGEPSIVTDPRIGQQFDELTRQRAAQRQADIESEFGGGYMAQAARGATEYPKAYLKGIADPLVRAHDKGTAAGAARGVIESALGASMIHPAALPFLVAGVNAEKAKESEAMGLDVGLAGKAAAAPAVPFEKLNEALPDFDAMEAESRRLGMPGAAALSEVGALGKTALPLALMHAGSKALPAAARAVNPFREAPPVEANPWDGALRGKPDPRPIAPLDRWPSAATQPKLSPLGPGDVAEPFQRNLVPPGPEQTPTVVTPQGTPSVVQFAPRPAPEIGFGAKTPAPIPTPPVEPSPAALEARIAEAAGGGKRVPRVTRRIGKSAAGTDIEHTEPAPEAAPKETPKPAPSPAPEIAKEQPRMGAAETVPSRQGPEAGTAPAEGGAPKSPATLTDEAFEKAVAKAEAERTAREAAQAKTVAPAAEKPTPEPSPAPVAPEVKAEPQAPTKKPWDMTHSELDDAYRAAKTAERDADVRALGPELAKRWKAARSKADSPYLAAGSDAAKAADAALDAIESKFTPEQRRVVFGEGETGPSAEELRDFANAASRTRSDAASGADALGRGLGKALSDIGDATDPETMNHTQRVAYIKLKTAEAAIREFGLDAATVERAAKMRAVERFGNAEDAAYMLRRWINPEQRAAPILPEPQAPAPPRRRIGKAKKVVPPEGPKASAPAPEPAMPETLGKGGQAPTVSETAPEVAPAIEAVKKTVRKGREGPTLGSGLGGLQTLMPEEAPPPAEIPEGATPKQAAAVGSMKSSIRFGERTKDPLWERIKRGASQAQAELVRRESPIRNLERTATGKESPSGPTALAKFAQGSSAKGAANLFEYGVLDTADRVPALKEKLREVHDSGRPLSDVSAYILAKRFKTGYEPRSFKSGQTPEATQATIDLYEKDPKLKPVVDAANAYFDAQRALREDFMEADRWSEERKAKLRKDNPFPANVHRELGENETGLGSPTGTSGPFKEHGYKRVIGSNAGSRDVLVTAQEDFRRQIAMADQARLKHSVLDLVKGNPEKLKGFIEEVPPDKVKETFPDFQSLSRELNPDMDPQHAEAVFRAYDKAHEAGLIPVQDGGKVRLFRVFDKTLRDALKHDTADNAGIVLRVIGDLNAIRRAGITGGPSFPVANALRDLGSYIAQSKQPNEVKLWTNLARGMYHSIRGAAEGSRVPLTKRRIGGTPVTEAYERARVETYLQANEGARVADIERIDKGFRRYYQEHPWRSIKAPFKTAYRGYKGVTNIAETGFRMAELINSLEAQGWEPGKPLTREMLTKASNDAGEVTVNFRLGGERVKFANRYLYNFINPAVQGVETYRQTLANQPKLAARRALTYGVAPAVAAYLYFQSDPKRKEAWDRMKPWRKAMPAIPVMDDAGNVHILSLPSPQEPGAIYAATIAALDAVGHDDPKRIADAAKEVAGRMSPVNWPPIPSIAEGAWEHATGRKLFGDMPVNPQDKIGAKEYAPETVAWDYTADYAKWLSKFLHQSTGGASKLTAAEVENYVNTTLGPLARDAMRGASGGEKEASDLPVVGRFFVRVKESSHLDKYWEDYSLVKGVADAASTLKRDADPRYANASAARMVLSKSEAIHDGIMELLKRYKDAPEKDRPALAKTIDALAKAGSAILGPIGARLEQAPKEPAK